MNDKEYKADALKTILDDMYDAYKYMNRVETMAVIDRDYLDLKLVSEIQRISDEVEHLTNTISGLECTARKALYE